MASSSDAQVSIFDSLFDPPLALDELADSPKKTFQTELTLQHILFILDRAQDRALTSFETIPFLEVLFSTLVHLQLVEYLKQSSEDQIEYLASRIQEEIWKQLVDEYGVEREGVCNVEYMEWVAREGLEVEKAKEVWKALSLHKPTMMRFVFEALLQLAIWDVHPLAFELLKGVFPESPVVVHKQKEVLETLSKSEFTSIPILSADLPFWVEKRLQVSIAARLEPYILSDQAVPVMVESFAKTFLVKDAKLDEGWEAVVDALSVHAPTLVHRIVRGLNRLEASHSSRVEVLKVSWFPKVTSNKFLLALRNKTFVPVVEPSKKRKIETSTAPAKQAAVRNSSNPMSMVPIMPGNFVPMPMFNPMSMPIPGSFPVGSFPHPGFIPQMFHVQNSAVRPRGTGCFKCGQEGHKSFECKIGSETQSKTSGCYKCGQDGHRFYECPSSTEASQQKAIVCFKCGQEGHKNFECTLSADPSQQKPSVCFKCGREGHKALDCPTDSNQRTTACYKCGQEGHKAFDCSSDHAQKLSMICFNCGKDGHKSFDCPSADNQLKSSGCFKCGKEGHKSFECPSDNNTSQNKPSAACYKCGQEGHRFFECTLGGPDKANTCFKCGKEGHKAFECNGTSETNAHQINHGAVCFKCGKEGHKAFECHFNPSVSFTHQAAFQPPLMNQLYPASQIHSLPALAPVASQSITPLVGYPNMSKNYQGFQPNSVQSQKLPQYGPQSQQHAQYNAHSRPSGQNAQFISPQAQVQIYPNQSQNPQSKFNYVNRQSNPHRARFQQPSHAPNPVATHENSQMQSKIARTHAAYMEALNNPSTENYQAYYNLYTETYGAYPVGMGS